MVLASPGSDFGAPQVRSGGACPPSAGGDSEGEGDGEGEVEGSKTHLPVAESTLQPSV